MDVPLAVDKAFSLGTTMQALELSACGMSKTEGIAFLLTA
jgi:hypothetical protein